MTGHETVPGSFRDPSGFVYVRDGILYRQINEVYRDAYDQLLESGLYEVLVGERLLIPHQEASLGLAASEDAHKVLRPQPLMFLSYPYEWCFSQLKDAALATLRVQEIALRHGMVLKDASSYNIQFHEGRPVLIDTLSFEAYRENEPWIAYRQFCQHFLAPLALASRCDHRLTHLLSVFLDGVPLGLAARLLPRRTLLRLPLLLHLHLQARAERGLAEQGRARRGGRVSRQGLLGILDSLRSGIDALTWRPKAGMDWADYYQRTNYSQEAWSDKQAVVERFLDLAAPEIVWDLGANTGVFSRLAARRAKMVVALDADAAAVEANYRQCASDGETRVLPLVVDLTNPSPGVGWDNRERPALLDRGRPDILLALALVHHLAIGNNLPLAQIAQSFARLGDTFVVEFVPKTDSQVRRMLETREDIFTDYSQQGFERAFARHFRIRESHRIRGSERQLYLMAKASG